MLKVKTNHRSSKKGSSLVELIIVTLLFIVLVPASLGIFLGARKITGQSYVQHEAALTLGETNDVLRYLRNQDYSLLVNGDFYLIRNPGSDNWLVKNDLPVKDVFERHIIVSDAKRHTDTDHLYIEGDTGNFYDDAYTKRIDINILWAPDYLPLDIISQTIYVTGRQNVFIY